MIHWITAPIKFGIKAIIQKIIVMKSAGIMPSITVCFWIFLNGVSNASLNIIAKSNSHNPPTNRYQSINITFIIR